MASMVGGAQAQVVNNDKVVYNDYSEVITDNFEFISHKTGDKVWAYDKAEGHIGSNPEAIELAYRPIRGLYISGFATGRTYPENTVPGVGGGIAVEPWRLLFGADFSIGFGSKDAPNSEKQGRKSTDSMLSAYAGFQLASLNKRHTDVYLLGEFVLLTNKDFQSLGIESTSVVDKEVEGGIERTTTKEFHGESYDNKPYVHGFGGGILIRHHFTFSPLSIFVKGTAGMVNSWNRRVTANGKESAHDFYATVSVGVSYNLFPAHYNVQAMSKLGLSKADVRKIARESGKRGLKTLNAMANY